MCSFCIDSVFVSILLLSLQNKELNRELPSENSVEGEVEQESVSSQLRRAFRERWMWIGAISANAGLVLVEGIWFFCGGVY